MIASFIVNSYRLDYRRKRKKKPDRALWLNHKFIVVKWEMKKNNGDVIR